MKMNIGLRKECTLAQSNYNAGNKKVNCPFKLDEVDTHYYSAFCRKCKLKDAIKT